MTFSLDFLINLVTTLTPAQPLSEGSKVTPVLGNWDMPPLNKQDHYTYSSWWTTYAPHTHARPLNMPGGRRVGLSGVCTQPLRIFLHRDQAFCSETQLHCPVIKGQSKLRGERGGEGRGEGEGSGEGRKREEMEGEGRGGEGKGKGWLMG